jgi:hypothetical protein
MSPAEPGRPPVTLETVYAFEPVPAVLDATSEAHPWRANERWTEHMRLQACSTRCSASPRWLSAWCAEARTMQFPAAPAGAVAALEFIGIPGERRSSH